MKLNRSILLSLLLLLALSLSTKTLALEPYTELLTTAYDDRYDSCSTSYNDAVYTSDTISEDFIFLYVPEDIDTNTSVQVKLYNNITLRYTINGLSLGWNMIEIDDYTPYAINKVTVCFGNEYQHIYDISGELDKIDDVSLGEGEEWYDSLMALIPPENRYLEGYAKGVSDARANIDAIVDEYTGYGTSTTGADTYDDASYNEGYDDGYAVGFADEIDYSVFTNLLSEMGGIFTMEIMPNITIGMLASIPIAFALFRWFLKLRG